MEAKELRIGNWFNDTLEGGGHFQVEQICKDSGGFNGYYIAYRNGSFKMSLEEDEEEEFRCIQPIPLTQEWLLKCGFERIIGAKKRIYKLTYYSTIFTYDEDGYFRVNGLFVSCHFVHTLQNLYFALTGEELTIKE
jgi:hypothetical protein